MPQATPRRQKQTTPPHSPQIHPRPIPPPPSLTQPRPPTIPHPGPTPAPTKNDAYDAVTARKEAEKFKSKGAGKAMWAKMLS
jgi:hypothetical protein